MRKYNEELLREITQTKAGQELVKYLNDREIEYTYKILKSEPTDSINIAKNQAKIELLGLIKRQLNISK